ncbi:hypothetical protein [Hymenobacter koreensis]|uniref:DUF2487 family protein n=1 Tax=Hymenobacter koreensis TaxID=1084523 RepID=A0ABP8JDB8_9BACT
MNQNNIWEKIDFTEQPDESAYDLLAPQAELLSKLTEGVLKMELYAIDSVLGQEPPIPVAVYSLYVVAPHLGNFKRKIIAVLEGRHTGRFPVDIYCEIDQIKDEGIEKDNFVEKVTEIMSREAVKRTIENLYRQSREHLRSLSNKQKPIA